MNSKLLPATGIVTLGLLGAGLHAGSGTGPAVAAAALPGAQSASGDPAKCAQLTGQRVAGAVIDNATFIATGTRIPPFNIESTAPACRVRAHVAPVTGSEIKIEIWLPGQWNGKFLGVGGGGFEGGYATASLGLSVSASKGFAGVATNAGHDPAPDPRWALNQPEKVADYGHRANHLGAVVGKALAAQYYGVPVKRAYFQGCSNGGRDALMLAQRHPQDYDAIAVGAPANEFTGLMTSFTRFAQLALTPGVDLSAAKMKLVHQAAIAKCDKLDGVVDGLLERPTQCRFDPAVLQCKPGAATDCLSGAEVATVKAIYRGTRTRSGRIVMPGLPVGSEYQWPAWVSGRDASGPIMGRQFFGYLVHSNPKWDVAAFDIDRDYGLARKQVGPAVDAVDPDLRPFLRRGGKLLMYHGWDDAAIPAGNTLRYHAAMMRASGRPAARQTRLFMLPGVGHCLGGNGPSSIDYVAELDRWSESGTAPERLVATLPDNMVNAMMGLPSKTLRSRPICAWPKSARYKGTGSIDDAENFVCR
jgi:pimeloyl-ACP methyl ester carboxylesterase